MSNEKRSKSSLSELGVTELSSDLTPEVIVSFYEALDCPRALTAAILYRYGENDQLVGLECVPSNYESSESFRDAYLASSLLLRSNFLETTYVRDVLALLKFQHYEQQCAKTNSRLNPFRVLPLTQPGPVNPETGSEVQAALLSKMRRKIEGILGDFNPEEMYDLCSWGPGVSTAIKGDETFAARKFQYETGVTRDLYPLVVGTFPTAYPHWWKALEANEGWPHMEVGNVIITVPKTSKIDRVIAVEPGLNLWFQLGLGRMIRRRLGRVGIDLTDQGRNQRAARKASMTDDLVTVDFSSASDSIAFELVRNLFSGGASFCDEGVTSSTRWFEVMDVIRSKYGTLSTSPPKGKKVNTTFRWNKFSSMGNGFTFDLETLIFYAAAVVSCESVGCSIADVSVYGDDVILPTVAYECFSLLSTYLGFTVNKQKSFASGPFRESCGAHYYLGRDCKPLFMEEELTLPSRVYNFASLLRIRAQHQPYGCEDRFRELFYKLVASVPKAIRFRVSAIKNSESGEIEPLEGGFVSNLDEANPTKAKHCVEGYSVKRLSWVPVMVEPDYYGLLLSRLVSIAVPLTDDPLLDLGNRSKKSDRNKVPLRNRTECIVKHTPVRQWYDLGPWL